MRGAEVLETTTSVGLVSRGLQSAGERVETTSHPQPDCKEGHKGKNRHSTGQSEACAVSMSEESL